MWIGYLFIDVGFVVLLFLSGKKKFEELSKEDIENVVNFVFRLYV